MTALGPDRAASPRRCSSSGAVWLSGQRMSCPLSVSKRRRWNAPLLPSSPTTPQRAGAGDLFVPKPSRPADCQFCGTSGLPATVRQCPLVSLSSAGRCYSLRYSLFYRARRSTISAVRRTPCPAAGAARSRRTPCHSGGVFRNAASVGVQVLSEFSSGNRICGVA